MPTTLLNQFRNRHGCNRRVIEVMSACRNGYRTITAVVIGCGDAFINRYCATLEQRVNLGTLKLIVADQLPIDKLVANKIELAQKSGETDSATRLQTLYDKFRTMLARRPEYITYLDLSNKDDLLWYKRLTADIVFILVPDDIHVWYANDWLKRATLVIVEKPYDRDVVSAQRFEQVLQQMARVNGERFPFTKVVCVDHYLAKIAKYVLQSENESLRRQIGAIKRIEFSLCEAGGVEPWRAPALEAGMIYDLFCHVLAQASPFIKLESFLSRIREPDSQILVARHQDCPIKSESYGYFDLPFLLDHQHRDIGLVGSVGKGVGAKDSKYLHIVGERGTLVADFSPGADKNIRLRTAGGEDPLFKIGQGHTEMLEAIFEGRFIREPVGGLDGNEAVHILQILTYLRGLVSRQLSSLANQAYAPGLEPTVINQQAVSLLA